MHVRKMGYIKWVQSKLHWHTIIGQGRAAWRNKIIDKSECTSFRSCIVWLLFFPKDIASQQREMEGELAWANHNLLVRVIIAAVSYVLETHNKQRERFELIIKELNEVNILLSITQEIVSAITLYVGESKSEEKDWELWKGKSIPVCATISYNTVR